MFSKADKILIIILILTALIRFYDLPRGNVVSDEALYGFRSIGYLDFSFALAQPTTLQLFENTIPWWTKFSFHDHPPLVFLIQHCFIKLFGINLWGLRLSSALFGFFSIYLIFLIGQKLFSRKTGLIASVLLTANVLMVYVSRTAIQEAQVIFFILLTVYLFIKARDNPPWYLAAGASFGLALLTKYTVVFLIIPLLIYLLFNRSAMRKPNFYGGILLALIIFSPVIIYNLLLFQTFGHFDFQLSHILSQEVPYWQEAPGKEIGAMPDRAEGIFKNFWFYNSPVFNLLALFGLGFLIVQAWLKRKSPVSFSYSFLLLIIISNLFFYLIIGPGVRFLTMLVPWLALAVALAFVWLIESKLKSFALTMFFLIIAWEIFYSINSCILYKPIGKEILNYSRIHWDMHAWGFNKLDAFLDKLLENQYPGLTIPYNLQFLEEVKSTAIEKAQSRAEQPSNILIIYNDNIFDLASMWVFNRWSLYQAWPMLPAVAYQQMLTVQGENYFKDKGFTDFYFIQPAENMLLNSIDRQTKAGDELENQLRGQGITPTIISNHNDQEAFRIYYYN